MTENVSLLPLKQASNDPNKNAVIYWNSARHYSSITFAQLSQNILKVHHSVQRQKIVGRVLMLAPPSLLFPSTIFGLFHSGITPVFIDPGMGLKSLIRCVQRSNTQTIVTTKTLVFCKTVNAFHPSIRRVITVEALHDSQDYHQISAVLLIQQLSYLPLEVQSSTTGYLYS